MSLTYTYAAHVHVNCDSLETSSVTIYTPQSEENMEFILLALYPVKYLVDLVTDVLLTFDVDLHRPKKARGNEKDKPPSGVKPRPNDQQTSTLDTEPRSPDKSLSPHSLL